MFTCSSYALSVCVCKLVFVHASEHVHEYMLSNTGILFCACQLNLRSVKLSGLLSYVNKHCYPVGHLGI